MTETVFRLPILQIPTHAQCHSTDLNTIMERNCIRMLLCVLEACAHGDVPARAIDVAIAEGWHHCDPVLDLTKFVMTVPRKHDADGTVVLELAFPQLQEHLPALVAKAMGEMDARVRRGSEPCDCDDCKVARATAAAAKEASVGLH